MSTIKYAALSDLFLDPLNPRLGRNNTSKNLSQSEILSIMKDWTLDELAVSFIENGFWPQEALIVVKESIRENEDVLVVIEGNRRLAALKLLEQSYNGSHSSKKWNEIVKSTDLASTNLFKEIPYIVVSNRKEVSAFLGFRHVTGIKEWEPAEKAEYICKLIEEEKFSYDEVRKKIGSKTPVVRQHYIAYKLLLQMEDIEGIDIGRIENKFSVLYLALRTSGVQNYLKINIKAEPDEAKRPVPEESEKALINFAKWIFGTEKSAPLFTDSRLVDKFAATLENAEAVEYLENSDDPKIEIAFRKSGSDEDELIAALEKVEEGLEIAFSTLHLHKNSPNVTNHIKKILLHFEQVRSMFPSLYSEVKNQE